jgi:hypothetical protein
LIRNADNVFWGNSSYWRLWGIFCLYLTLITALPKDCIAQARTPTEYEVKAAFLFNLIKYTDWPLKSKAPTNQWVIGIYGENPFGESLQSVIAGRPLNGRQVVIKTISTEGEAERCHIVFIGKMERDRVPSLLKFLSQNSILSVGESENFLDLGGMVQFQLHEEKVRLLFNMGPIERGELKINSNLLRLFPVRPNNAK